MRKIYMEAPKTELFPAGEELPNLMFISRVHQNPNWVIAPVKNDQWCEVIYVDAGKAYYTINGKSYVAVAGDLVILNLSAIHDARSDQQEPVDRYSCAFRALKLAHRPVNHIISDRVSPVIPLGAWAPLVAGCFKMVMACCSEPGKNTYHICQHAICAILAVVDELAGARPQLSEPPNQNPLVQEILQYIDGHFMESLSLETIAGQFFISPDYLSHLVKDSTGQSPISYMINRRIGESQHLLLSTMLPIGLIAELVGYPNVNHFSAAFKKKIGVAPGEFRRQFNIASIPPNVSKREMYARVSEGKPPPPHG